MESNTILVIDDDRNILAIIELYLKKADFKFLPVRMNIRPWRRSMKRGHRWWF